MVFSKFLYRVFWPASHVQPYKDNCGIDNDVADHVMNTGIHVFNDKSDWEEPPLALYHSRMQLSNGSDGVYYAFHLLQTDPSVQVCFIVNYDKHNSIFLK